MPERQNGTNTEMISNNIDVEIGADKLRLEEEKKGKERIIGKGYNELIYSLLDKSKSIEEKKQIFEKKLALLLSMGSENDDAIDMAGKRVESNEEYAIKNGDDDNSKMRTLLEASGADEELIDMVIENGCKITKYYKGIYRLDIPTKQFIVLYEKIVDHHTPQAVAVLRKEIEFLMTRKEMGNNENENVPHELHHVIYRILLRSGIVSIKHSEQNDELGLALGRYKDELLARLVSTDVTTSATSYSESKEAGEKSWDTSLFVGIVKAAGKQFGFQREDFIFAVMKSSSYDEIAKNVKKILPDRPPLTIDVLNYIDTISHMYEDEDIKSTLQLIGFTFGDNEIKEIIKYLLESEDKSIMEIKYNSYQRTLGLIEEDLGVVLEELKNQSNAPEGLKGWWV